MARRNRLGVAVIVSVIVLTILTPVTWAQSPTSGSTSTPEQQTAAGAANIVYIPAKTLFCIGGGVSWLGVLVLSGGTAYNLATEIVRAGCGGKWVLEGADIHLASSQTPAGAR